MTTAKKRRSFFSLTPTSLLSPFALFSSPLRRALSFFLCSQKTEKTLSKTKKIQETIEREGRLADLARRNAAASGSSAAAASAASPSSSSNNKLKRAEKLQSSMKLELLKEMGVVRVKQVFVGLLSMMGLLRVMTHNFEGVPLLRLPFEPFKMLRSVAHRGLKEEDALPAVAGYVSFVFGVAGERGWSWGEVGKKKKKSEKKNDPKIFQKLETRKKKLKKPQALIFMLVQAGLRPTLAKLIDGGPTRRMNELQVQYQTQVTESSGGVVGAAAAAARGGGSGGGGGGGGGGNNSSGLRRRR